MTLLDEIIDASTDGSVAAPDLLRKVQIVAHRLGAIEVTNWVKQELEGYPSEAPLPEYRKQSTGVLGVFAFPGRSFQTVPLTEVPKDMASLWVVELREPLRELQALSEVEKDPSREWTTSAVDHYEKSGAYRLEFGTLFQAKNVVTRQALAGILDIVRSKALEFALELQASFPDAGSKGGPTVASDPSLSTTVFHITNNIYGDGANVAAGSDITQRTKVTKGDASALLQAVSEIIGFGPEAAEFVAAVTEQRDLDDPRVAGFIERVRTGAVKLAGSVGSSVAANVLIEIARAYIGV